MLLADLGADVLRVDRVEEASAIDRSRPAGNPMHRGKRAVALDLKHPDGVEAFLRLTDAADAAFEVFRPGVAERLGIGPDDCRRRNPRLVYGRLTGWGQDGPLAARAGHDIDYIAVAGALDMLGRAGAPPTPPINVLGDFAGGALMLAPFYGARASGAWGERGTNLLDTGAPFYDVYETADGQWVAVGAIEPQFYAALLERLGLDDEDLPDQMDTNGWPELRKRFEAVFRTRTRDEWCAHVNGVDACVAPVLTPVEALGHEQARARHAFIELRAVPQPAPAPRFSRSAPSVPEPPEHPGEATADALCDWGFDDAEITRLVGTGVLV